MSHFSKIKTKFKSQRHLVEALRQMQLQPQEGNVLVTGFAGQHTEAEIRIPTKSAGYDIGFRKSGDHFVCVADWYGVRGIQQKPFLQELTQRYARVVVEEKLSEQGFSLAAEKTEQGRIHLVLRRAA